MSATIRLFIRAVAGGLLLLAIAPMDALAAHQPAHPQTGAVEKREALAANRHDKNIAGSPQTSYGPEAEAERRWDLDALMDEAARANPTLLATMAQQPIAKGAVMQARRRPNPVLNVQVAPVEQTYHPVDLAVTIQPGGKRKLQARIAERQLESAQAATRAMAWKIREDVRQRYYAYAVSRQAESLMRRYLGEAEALLSEQAGRKKQSDDDPDILQAKMALAEDKTLLPPLEARSLQLRRELNMLLGRAPDRPLEIMTPEIPWRTGKPLIPASEMTALNAKAREARAEYGQYASEISTQQEKLRLAEAERWPNLMLGGGVSMVAQTRRHFWGENFRYGPEFYLQMPLPVLDRQQATRYTAQATVLQLKMHAHAFDLQVSQDIAQALAHVDGAAQQLELLNREIVPLHERAGAVDQKRYHQGRIGLDDWMNARRSAMQAQLHLIQTWEQYFEAYIELERSVGQNLALEFSL